MNHQLLATAEGRRRSVTGRRVGDRL